MNTSLLLIAQIGFALLTVIYFGLLLKQIKVGIEKTTWQESRKKKYYTRLIASLVVWIVLVSVWSLSGIMANFANFPFNFMPVIVIPLIAIVIFTFSESFKEVLQNIPNENLLRLQSFRFFVEILLWILFIDNILPVQMTFEGRNFDILAGITGPIVAWLWKTNRLSRTALIIWNIVCLCLLINIVTVAIVSTPSPVRVFMNEPANTIVTHFPVSFLPGLLVPLAYMLHFFSLRQLAVQRKPGVATADV